MLIVYCFLIKSFFLVKIGIFTVDLKACDQENRIIEAGLIKYANSQCVIYIGALQNKYGLVKFSFQGTQLSLYANIVAKMHNTGTAEFGPFLSRERDPHHSPGWTLKLEAEG